jgi:hypothetical protein
MAGDRARVRVTSERARAINQKPKNQKQTVEADFHKTQFGSRLESWGERV